MAKNSLDLKQELRTALLEIGVATKDDLTKLEKRIMREMRREHRDIRGDIAKLATSSPTYEQFMKLKEKVDRFHPTS